MENVKIYAKTVEETAMEQIKEIAKHPAFKDVQIRIMPDVHAGKGCVIGFTAPFSDVLIPNLVGVDIGCGMHVVELGKVDIDLEKFDEVVKHTAPSGFNVWEEASHVEAPLEKLSFYNELDKAVVHYFGQSLGTIGGGNHFVEIDMDEEGNKYLVIHTGSRNLGIQVAKYHQEKAIKYCQEVLYNARKKEINEKVQEFIAAGRQTEIQEYLENHKPELNFPKDLAYLEGEDCLAYLEDMKIAQQYALENRKVIAHNILTAYFGHDNFDSFDTIHNYISPDDHMIRKSAISAKDGEKLIIPINMRDGSIIGVGKGNKDWNCSAPHGAGRLMSRAAAKKTLNLEDFKSEMAGVYSTTVCKDTLDEAPDAYKPMDEIVELIQPTVDIQKIIKPIYNYKASEVNANIRFQR